MLNHQQWFTDLYDRHEVSYDPAIETPAGDTRAEQTLDLMRQLKLRGEVEWPASQPVGHIDFNVARPNGAAQVRVDLNAKQAYVKEFKNGRLHAFQIFHTFSGSRFNQPASRRDWILTSLWVFAMDALAVGTHRDGARQLLHVVAAEEVEGARHGRLAIGFATCGAFVAGLLSRLSLVERHAAIRARRIVRSAAWIPLRRSAQEPPRTRTLVVESSPKTNRCGARLSSWAAAPRSRMTKDAPRSMSLPVNTTSRSKRQDTCRRQPASWWALNHCLLCRSKSRRFPRPPSRSSSLRRGRTRVCRISRCVSK